MKTEKNRLAHCQQMTSKEPVKKDRKIKYRKSGGIHVSGSEADLGKFQESLAKYKDQLQAVRRSKKR